MISIIGPLPETKSGEKYIVTLIDYFSKWPEAEALANKDADSAAFSRLHVGELLYITFNIIFYSALWILNMYQALVVLKESFQTRAENSSTLLMLNCSDNLELSIEYHQPIPSPDQWSCGEAQLHSTILLVKAMQYGAKQLG